MNTFKCHGGPLDGQWITTDGARIHMWIMSGQNSIVDLWITDPFPIEQMHYRVAVYELGAYRNALNEITHAYRFDRIEQR